MDVPIALGHSERLTGRFPTVVQRNLIAEKTATQIAKPVELFCRPGLLTFPSVGSAPIRGVAQRVGMFNGDAIVVAAQTVYKVTAAGIAVAYPGTVPGFGRVRIAIGRNGNDEDVARIATGAGLFLVERTGVTEEDFPDSSRPGCADIEYHRFHWLAIEAGTDKTYYQLPGSSTWTALEFASAEYAPDPSVAIRTRGDQIWIMGQKTVEGWALTGQQASPIEPYGGYNFDYGCRARDTAVTIADQASSALLFVDSNSSVRLTRGGAPEIVSDPGLAEQIRLTAAENLRAWGFTFDQHFYYVLTLGDTETAVYDLSANLWGRFTSAGYTYWRAHLGCDIGDGKVLCADALANSNTLWLLDPAAEDDDGDPIITHGTAYLELKEGSAPCYNAELECSVGYVDRTETDPVVSLRWSDDGQVYGEWITAPLPLAGNYSPLPSWDRLGTIEAPRGRWFQFRCSDATVKRYAGLRVNV